MLATCLGTLRAHFVARMVSAATLCVDTFRFTAGGNSFFVLKYLARTGNATKTAHFSCRCTAARNPMFCNGGGLRGGVSPVEGVSQRHPGSESE